MSASRQVWLIAGETEPWCDPLAAQLVAQGMQIERIPSAQTATWRHAAHMPEVRILPQLLVLSAAEARLDDWALLRLLDRAAVWRCLPRVVVAQPGDREAITTSHALGAANVVSLPPDNGPESAERFARYWARTTLLPTQEYLLG